MTEKQTQMNELDSTMSETQLLNLAQHWICYMRLVVNAHSIAQIKFASFHCKKKSCESMEAMYG